MSRLGPLRRECLHLARDRAFICWTVLTLLLAIVAVSGGLNEVANQHSTIARLLEGDRADRASAQASHADWGSAAYYSFHLTYDAPSKFAFAAMGVRDREPWKHRVRMLAIEAQIYERDAGNPALALIGRFDFAFFAAFVLPLILIVLLHDIVAKERSAGRDALLISTSGRDSSPWRLRAVLRAGAVFVAAAVPLFGGCVLSGTAISTSVIAIALLLAYIVFWSALAYRFAQGDKGAPVILASLLGVWLLLGIIGPTASKLAIDAAVPVPAGADILMTQREAVNGAWDIPKEVTMEAFVSEYPEWERYSTIETPFEWKWYYAFQQVGDQKAEPLSQAFRDGRLRRDTLAGVLAWLTPPALIERLFQNLAHTNLRAHIAYEKTVRDFHAELRSFYYAKLFPEEPFDQAALEDLPEFSAANAD